jgi:vancomycin resistance protein VanJ
MESSTTANGSDSLPGEPLRPGPPRLGRLEAIFVGLSLAILIATSLAFAYRPDAAYALTVWPAWAWPIAGWIALIPAVRRNRRQNRVAGGTAVLWLLFLLVFSEEPRSLLRLGAWPTGSWLAARQEGRALRIVSLNCAGGTEEAALELKRFEPDIACLQESPSRASSTLLAQSVCGPSSGRAWGPDGSILAAGSVVQADLPPEETIFFTHATVRTKSGREVEVFSARLLPSVLRFDIWSPSAWREYADNRHARMEQMRIMATRINAVPTNRPIILAGDFNAPQGDAIFHLLRPRLRDAFGEAGRGWGNTIVNDYPLLRIDQIWISKELRAEVVFAQKTENSDHRAVICDLVFEPER